MNLLQGLCRVANLERKFLRLGNRRSVLMRLLTVTQLEHEAGHYAKTNERRAGFFTNRILEELNETQSFSQRRLFS